MQNNTTTKPINQNKMKNIHVLVTDKPSRLHLGNSGLVLCDLIFNPTTINAQHIYITSDEEIKEEDWFYNTISLKPEPFKACENGDGYVNCSRYSHYRIDCKKIILTTDQDLIKDGVQPIDDEFLEWFVKNPSCEEVDVKPMLSNNGRVFYGYKIIIPIDEPKQIKCYCGHTTMCDCSPIEEAFGIIYVLETLLDFAGEDNATSISISTTDAEKIIKLLKQI